MDRRGDLHADADGPSVRGFSLLLALYGMSDFFITLHMPTAAWVILWKLACIAPMAAILVVGRGAKKCPNGRIPSHSGP